MKIEMICWCGSHYFARESDVKRGWGLSCSKSHAAIRRDYGKPRATRVDGIVVKKVSKSNRGANRLTPDTRQYVLIDDKLVDTRKVSKSLLADIAMEKEWDSLGHIFESGYFGHGQE